jgi:predicted acyl esterase
MINEEKVIISDDINLGATIAYKDKKEKRPLVLLIAGTGSSDRDGNSLGFKSNIYKELSDMFVEMGYVCIRYDKRGTHESKGAGLNFGLSDLVNDAANIIHYAKKLDYVDEEKVVVCGHSEGAMIATLLTKNEDLDLKGIILLSGACMSLKDAMMYQNYLVLDQVKDMKGILGWFLRRVLKKENIEKQISDFFLKAEHSKKNVYFYKGSIIPTKYTREHNALTKEYFIELLKAYKGKILAITDRSDVQADYRVLEKISSFDNVTTDTPEQVNHVLRGVDGESNIMNIKKEYKLSFKKPISTKIKNSIKDWSEKL